MALIVNLLRDSGGESVVCGCAEKRLTISPTCLLTMGVVLTAKLKRTTSTLFTSAHRHRRDQPLCVPINHDTLCYLLPHRYCPLYQRQRCSISGTITSNVCRSPICLHQTFRHLSRPLLLLLLPTPRLLVYRRLFQNHAEETLPCPPATSTTPRSGLCGEQ